MNNIRRMFLSLSLIFVFGVVLGIAVGFAYRDRIICTIYQVEPTDLSLGQSAYQLKASLEEFSERFFSSIAQNLTPQERRELADLIALLGKYTISMVNVELSSNPETLKNTAAEMLHINALLLSKLYSSQKYKNSWIKATKEVLNKFDENEINQFLGGLVKNIEKSLNV